MKRGVETVFFTACILAGGLLAVGCQAGVQPLWSQAKPETVVKINPLSRTVTVHNSTDTDISLGEFSGKTAAGTEWRVTDLKFVANASSVRTANVAQMEMSRQITDAVMQGFAAWLAQAMAPLRGANVTIDTPIGGGSLTTGGQETEPPAETP